MDEKGINITKVSNEVVITSSSAISESDVNTSKKLTVVLLNEFNYLPWSRAITIGLGGRSRLGFINGKEKSPGSNIWLSKDQMVISWILNSMECSLAEIFSYSETSLDLSEAEETYMVTKTTLPEYFKFNKILLMFIKMEEPL